MSEITKYITVCAGKYELSKVQCCCGVNSSRHVSSLTCPLPVSDPPRLHVHLPGLLQTVPHRHQNPSAQRVGDHQAPALEQQVPRGQPGQKLFTGPQRPSCHQWKKSCYRSQLQWVFFKNLLRSSVTWPLERSARHSLRMGHMEPLRQSSRETSRAAPQTQAGK